MKRAAAWLLLVSVGIFAAGPFSAASAAVTPVYLFGEETYSFFEFSTSATLTVTRTTELNTAPKMFCEFEPYPSAPPTLGSDYSVVRTPLRWAKGGSSSATCAVPLMNDSVQEGLETLIVRLSGPPSAAWTPPVLVDIVDNDRVIIA